MGSAAYGHVGGTVALSRLLALRLDLLDGSTVARTFASAGGADRRPWGRAFGSALAGVEARWFLTSTGPMSVPERRS